MALPPQRLFDHRMTSALDGKAQREIHLGPYVVLIDGEFCERRRDVERGESMRRGAQIVAGGDGERAKPLEDFQLQPQCALAGVGDLGFDLAEFSRGEAGLAGEGLAMDEGRVEWRRHQSVAMLRRDLDEITEYVVVTDLQRLDASQIGVARLHRGHDQT